MSIVLIVVLCLIVLYQYLNLKDLKWEIEQDHYLSDRACRELEMYYEQELRNRDYVIEQLRGNISEVP